MLPDKQNPISTYDSMLSMTKYPPRDHQRRGVDLATPILAREGFFALFVDMGLGKTKMTLDLLLYFSRCMRTVDALIVVCPKAIMSVWVEQIAEHIKEPTVVYQWDGGKTKKDEQAFKAVMDNTNAIRCFIFNLEAFQQPNDALVKRLQDVIKIDFLLVCDESSYIKEDKAKRTGNLIKFSQHSRLRLILTGTEVVNSPLDLYTQFEFLHRGFWGYRSFWQFKLRYAKLQDRYGAGGRTFKEVVGYQHVDEILDRIAPYTFRAKFEDCVDLPDKIYAPIHVELSSEQARVYRELKKNLMTELEDGSMVEIEQAVTLFTKFRQLTGGAILNEDSVHVIEKMPAKLAVLMAEAEASTEQFIVWACFRHEVAMIRDALSKIDRVVCFDGEVSSEDRAENIRLFQEGEARFFVGNPQSGAFGLNLQVAHIQYIYSRHLSPAVNWQAEARTRRIGQAHACVYKPIIVRGTIDEYIEHLLAQKTGLREAFRSMDKAKILEIIGGD